VRHAMPLFACHGVPSGVGIALRYESNVRLLGIDRPELGLSSPHPIYNLMKVLWSGGMSYVVAVRAPVGHRHFFMPAGWRNGRASSGLPLVGTEDSGGYLSENLGDSDSKAYDPPIHVGSLSFWISSCAICCVLGVSVALLLLRVKTDTHCPPRVGYRSLPVGQPGRLVRCPGAAECDGLCCLGDSLHAKRHACSSCAKFCLAISFMP
jgi:hypothetical protein